MTIKEYLKCFLSELLAKNPAARKRFDDDAIRNLGTPYRSEF